MKKILIAGCGELGSRFLQAAVSLDQITEIDIIEPVQSAKQKAEMRMLEINRDFKTISVNWFPSISDTNGQPPGQLAVIATQADTRLAVFEQLLEAGYRNFLIEKIVVQSESQYQKMTDLTKRYQAKVWVNCKTRTYPVWKAIKAKIDPAEKIVYHSVGGNHGLATNGLHIIDLFVFLTGADRLDIAYNNIDPVLHLTKRQKYDFSGILHFSNPVNQSLLQLNYEAAHTQMPVEIIYSEKFRWIIDNSTRQAFESSAAGERRYISLPFNDELSVSFMSIKFIRDILENGQCDLPTMQECRPAHTALFSAILPVFNKLMHKEDDISPVT